MKFGIDKVARRAVAYAVEVVTDIAMGADGTVEAKGADDRPVSTVAGWHFGFYSRPKDGAIGMVLSFLGISALFAYRDAQFEMSLEKGEVGIQNAFSASLLLNKNGEVVINGGSAKVARVGDHGQAGSLALVFNPGSGGASLSVTYTDPDGNVSVLATGSGNVALKTKQTEGADKVKA